MTEYQGKILFVIVMALLLLFILPVLRSRTGRSLSDLFFSGTGHGLLRALPQRKPRTTREPRINNGTKGELTAFIARLLRFTNKNGMALVAPGSVKINGRTAMLNAIVVTPARIIGIQCLGFGGTITPSGSKGLPWNQHINGEDKSIDDPIASAGKQQNILRTAADSLGSHDCIVETVTVFTNARTSFPEGLPDKVFTQESFTAYLQKLAGAESGSLDTRDISLKLAKLAGIQGRNRK